ncbi:hypothetical protein BDC45DRAFT_595865 [Circinella umbellata]|nr:hypothetical protein BDC45DRAFT_595865 [Circinella umbellata]
MHIILLHNLNSVNKSCSGTKLLFVTALHDRIFTPRRIDQKYDGDEYYLPRTNICTTEADISFYFVPSPVPCMSCLRNDYYKAQGQTLSTVGIYLEESVFAHGQLYVVLSSATDSANIKIALNRFNQTYNTVPKTNNNVVYHEPLLSSVTLISPFIIYCILVLLLLLLLLFYHLF